MKGRYFWKIWFFLLFFSGIGVFNLWFFDFVSANQSSSPVKQLEISRQKEISDIPPAIEKFRKEQVERQATKEAAQKARAETQRKQEAAEVGINVDPDCLVNGGCSFSIYDALDIRNDREAGERTSVMTFVNDIILGLTWFIGTVVAVSLILSGFYYIISPVDSGAKKKAMEGIKYSLIGMVIVSLSVVIVRLIQFLASGGS